MKRLSLSIVFVAAFASCATPGTPDKPGVISQAVDCGASEVKAKLPAIVDVASTCLLAADRKAAFDCLGKLAIDAGSDVVVVCGVRIVTGEATLRGAAGVATGQPNAERIVANGKAYLVTREVRFVDGP